MEGENPGRSPLAPGLEREVGETGRLTASAGLWVRDTARAGTRGTCCWRSPWAVSGGRAQLHPSAASCPPPSGVKFQPWRHRILGWGPSAPPPRPTFQGSPGRSTLWNSVPLAPLRSPEVAGEETLGRAPGRCRGADTGCSEFGDTWSRELGGRAEGGSGRGWALGHWRLGSCRRGWPLCASCSL